MIKTLVLIGVRIKFVANNNQVPNSKKNVQENNQKRRRIFTKTRHNFSIIKELCVITGLKPTRCNI